MAAERLWQTKGYRAHDPEKPVPGSIGDGNRFSDKIMRKQDVRDALIQSNLISLYARRRRTSQTA